jgi:hypothetical protein
MYPIDGIDILMHNKNLVAQSAKNIFTSAKKRTINGKKNKGRRNKENHKKNENT